MNEKVYKITYLFLIYLGVLLIAYPIDSFVYWDQCIYLLHSKFFAGLDIGYEELKFRPILLSLLTAPFWKFTSSIIPFKIFSIAFSFLLVFTCYKLNRYYFIKKNAIWVTFLVLFNGVLGYETRFFLTDIPATAFFTLSLVFLVRDSKKSSLISGVFLGCSVLMRLGMIYFVPIYLLYFFLNKRYKSFGYFVVGSIVTYLPYQIWIYSSFDELFINLRQAKFEGLNNAFYSLGRFKQILYTIGLFTPIIAIIGFIRANKYFWLISFFITLFIVPYNPENIRFLLPTLPLLALGVGFFYSKNLKNKIFVLSFTVITLELLFLGIHWRQKVAFNKPGQTSFVEQASNEIKNNFKEFTPLVTSINYPEFAFYADKIIKTPTKIVNNDKDFSFIDKSLFEESTKPLFISSKNSIPTSDWLAQNSNFKKVGSYSYLDFYTIVDLNYKKDFKQYRAFFVSNDIDKYSRGHGFLEINRKNLVDSFYFNYSATNKFYSIIPKKCFENEVVFTEKNNFELTKFNNDEVEIIIKPFHFGNCSNKNNIQFKIVFKRVKDLLN